MLFQCFLQKHGVTYPGDYDKKIPYSSKGQEYGKEISKIKINCVNKKDEVFKMAFKDLFKTKAERRAYAIGRKHEKKKRIKSKSFKIRPKTSLMDYHKKYRERNLGALSYNGKIYDTNFKKGPVEISKSEIKELRKEYQPKGVRMTDLEVADAYVRHMRRKFGVTDAKTGKWLGLLSDVEK